MRVALLFVLHNVIYSHMKNTLRVLLITSVIISTAHFVYAADPKCPDGYVCIKKDDPSLNASSSPCYLILQRIEKDKSGVEVKKDETAKDKPVVYQDGVIAYLKNYTEDHAGVWGVFGPGKGILSQTKEDFGFVVDLTLAKSKVVKSITITNNGNNEGWSTSQDGSIFGKNPYPLVVFDSNGRQLNNKYDQTLSFKEGKNELNVFGQIETPGLDRAEIIIIFADNTRIKANVYETAPVVNTDVPKMPKDKQAIDEIKKEYSEDSVVKSGSVWSRIKSILGF